MCESALSAGRDTPAPTGLSVLRRWAASSCGHSCPASWGAGTGHRDCTRFRAAVLGRGPCDLETEQEPSEASRASAPARVQLREGSQPCTHRPALPTHVQLHAHSRMAAPRAQLRLTPPSCPLTPCVKSASPSAPHARGVGLGRPDATAPRPCAELPRQVSRAPGGAPAVCPQPWSMWGPVETARMHGSRRWLGLWSGPDAPGWTRSPASETLGGWGQGPGLENRMAGGMEGVEPGAPPAPETTEAPPAGSRAAPRPLPGQASRLGHAHRRELCNPSWGDSRKTAPPLSTTGSEKSKD
uniref:Uncharacterized protein n=1 Tax=Rangifer tarandus platyrhynchus TaxID=3082113 RepID=A0ACB0FPH7_RANTA|nr:unnamed protein product [Rangifer tarandus platyrhynchus]